MRISPDPDRFLELAAEHTVVPVWTEVLADLETPVSAFLKLVGDDHGFVFESVEHGERWSRFSFIGRDPVATLVLREGVVTVTGDPGIELDTDHGMLAALEQLLAAHSSPDIEDLPPLFGGLAGFLGYDVVREIEHLPDAPPDDHGMPDAVMSLIGSLAVFDHWRQRILLIESVMTGGLDRDGLLAARARAVGAVTAAAERLAEPLAEPPAEPPDPTEDNPEVTSPTASGEYRRAVEVAKEHILAGDIFQVVLSQRFDLELGAEPFDVYRVLRQVNPSPYMYFLRTEGVTLVGSSPEPMVQLRGRTVISRPIAGTRRRGVDDEHDRRLAAELIEHPKERAEHVMLVDLARNDVGRVAYGFYR